jgi:hypothetical protein
MILLAIYLKKLIAAQTGTDWRKIQLKKWYVLNLRVSLCGLPVIWGCLNCMSGYTVFEDHIALADCEIRRDESRDVSSETCFCRILLAEGPGVLEHEQITTSSYRPSISDDEVHAAPWGSCPDLVSVARRAPPQATCGRGRVFSLSLLLESSSGIIVSADTNETGALL